MRALLLAAAALLPSPAIASDPSRYDQAVAARHAGDPAKAVELLLPLVAAEPGHADAWVQLGYAQLALGKLEEAREAFERALAIAPAYQDACDGLALVAGRRTDRLGRYQLDVDGAYSWLGDGRPDWREAAVQLRVDLSPAIALTGRLEAARRFGRNDVYGEARIDLRGARGSFGYALIGATPNADFRPQAQLGAGGGARIIDGPSPTVATVDARWARYPSGSVWTVSPGIEQYLANGKLWLTARWINLFERGRHGGGWLVRGDAELPAGLRIFAGAARAPDLSEGVAIDTRSLFAGVALNVSQGQRLRLSVSRDKPEGSAARTQLSIGTGVRF